MSRFCPLTSSTNYGAPSVEKRQPEAYSQVRALVLSAVL